jgi:hypothetical protein
LSTSQAASDDSSQRGIKKNKRKVKVGTPEVHSGEVHSNNPGLTQKKVRLPNWEHHEVIALIEAKRDEQQNKREVTDSRQYMVSAPDQWLAISRKVIGTIGGVYDRNTQACCNKWNTLNAEFKKVNDYMTGTGIACTYWELSP